MASKAKTITIDNDDVLSSTSVAAIAIAAPAPAPATKPSEQPTDTSQISVTTFRVAIEAQFSGSRAVIDHVATLRLTSDSHVEIEKLRVVFYDTWPELCYGKQGMTSDEAIKAREKLFDTKGADRDAAQVRIYDATRSAWKWIKEQCELKAPAKKRAANSGTGGTEGAADDTTIDPSKVTTFDELAQLAVDVAALIDLVATKATQAKIKSAGLITHMQESAKALRVQVATSRDGLK